MNPPAAPARQTPNLTEHIGGFSGFGRRAFFFPFRKQAAARRQRGAGSWRPTRLRMSTVARNLSENPDSSSFKTTSSSFGGTWSSAGESVFGVFGASFTLAALKSPRRLSLCLDPLLGARLALPAAASQLLGPAAGRRKWRWWLTIFLKDLPQPIGCLRGTAALTRANLGQRTFVGLSRENKPSW